MDSMHRSLIFILLLLTGLGCGSTDSMSAASVSGMRSEQPAEVAMSEPVKGPARTIPDAGRADAGGMVTQAGAKAPAAGSGGEMAGRDAPVAQVAAGSGGMAATASAGSGGESGNAGVAASANATWIPHKSWTCGMPDGIPSPKSGALAFEVKLQLGNIYKLGLTQFGDRVLSEITGGSVQGDELKATVMDRGLDWELTLPNSAQEIEQVTVLRTDDGTNIFMRSCGAAPSAQGEIRIVPDIEAPSTGRYSWLNDTKLVGTRVFDEAAKTITLTIYKLDSTSAPSDERIQIEEPDSLPDQTWDCAKAMGERDTELYKASVGIDGGSIAVGASKRGTRNIIPITGGMFAGRITGTVLSGGADFQLQTAGDLQLDARYTLKTDDGELIIIRNCGTFTTAVPVYETRADGPHAFLNQSKWLATGTGLGVGVVNMTIYEAKLP